jgi:hypothetical protein
LDHPFQIDRENLEKLYGDGFDDEDLYNEDFDASGEEDEVEDNGGKLVPKETMYYRH